MRSLVLGSLTSLALLLPACGGGGSGGGLGGPLPLQGLVVANNGSSAAVGGITITCAENGASSRTSRSGVFALEVPKGVTLHLEVDDPAAQGTDASDEDCSESEDGDADGSDIAGAEVEIEALGEDETCGVEIELVDGKVVDIRVTKEKDAGAGRKESGEGVLRPPEGAESKAYGEVEVGARGGCSWAELEVRGLPADAYDAVLVGPDGAEEVVGTIVVEEKEGHFAVESCEGDRPLPFGVGSVAELAGMTIEIRDADGVVRLRGEVPSVGADDVKEDDDKDEDGVKDDEGGDGKDGDAKGGDGGDVR